MTYPQLLTRALELAARWHEGQVRKHPSEQTPYIAHPASVGLLLMRAGADDETIAAGFLHDVIEDCGVTKDEIAVSMTPRVAALVGWVTELPKKTPWTERKLAYREHLRGAPPEALMIAAADHIHNLHSILETVQTSEDVWSLFHADKQTKIAHEREVYEIIRSRLSSPLVDLFASVLTEIEQLP